MNPEPSIYNAARAPRRLERPSRSSALNHAPGKVRRLKSGPISDYTASCYRATQKKRRLTSAVISAAGAIDTGSAAELGGNLHYRVRALGSEVIFQCGDRLIESAPLRSENVDSCGPVGQMKKPHGRP